MALASKLSVNSQSGIGGSMFCKVTMRLQQSGTIHRACPTAKSGGGTCVCLGSGKVPGGTAYETRPSSLSIVDISAALREAAVGGGPLAVGAGPGSVVEEVVAAATSVAAGGDVPRVASADDPGPASGPLLSSPPHAVASAAKATSTTVSRIDRMMPRLCPTTLRAPTARSRCAAARTERQICVSW
jgi:hypothetical protein